MPRSSALVLAAAALVAALAPAAAQAEVLKAETILPPGQSGFVSLTGVSSGTGSPHLYDQSPMLRPSELSDRGQSGQASSDYHDVDGAHHVVPAQ